MKYAYIESITLIEKLHRLYLDVIKVELEKMGIEDINNVQAMILYNIGDSQISIGELTNRGYYLGSNVSYNLKKMLSCGYAIQGPSPHDRRSSRVRLSEKGIALYRAIEDLLTEQVEELEKEGLPLERMRGLVKTLRDLEIYWEKISL